MPLLLTFLYSLLQDQLTDVRQRMQSIAENKNKLAAARDELRPIAVHGSMLYSLLSAMPAINHMYQTSLQQFLQILQLSLQRLVVPWLLIIPVLVKRRACLRMRELLVVSRLSFYILGPIRIATGRPVGPITAVNGSNNAYCWYTHSFYGLQIKIYIRPFFSRNSKICITAQGDLERQ